VGLGVRVREDVGVRLVIWVGLGVAVNVLVGIAESIGEVLAIGGVCLVIELQALIDVASTIATARHTDNWIFNLFFFRNMAASVLFSR
jgi:hypothetical protein